MAVDANGVPLHFILTGGNVSDFTMAPALIESVAAKNIIADTFTDATLSSAAKILSEIRALPITKLEIP